MAKNHVRGKDLIAAGFPEGPVISVAMSVMANHHKKTPVPEQLELLKRVLGAPEDYLEDPVFGPIAQKLIPKKKEGAVQEIDLIEQGVPFSIFGAEGIEAGALAQMQAAARLPIARSGALMPDAHAGYGLPIGGVLATENAVIPYGVGVDIGCRMCLSVFDIAPRDLDEKEKIFTRELIEATVFGAGGTSKGRTEHEILDRKEFYSLPLLRELQSKAAAQIGTSGGGNHFAEWGLVEIPHADPTLALVPGTYVGFLTHSGSRALGANVASHFTKIAKAKRMLPKEAANLAWLTLDEEEGQQYWLAMNLAGDYASACHHVIHDKIAKALGRAAAAYGGEPPQLRLEGAARGQGSNCASQRRYAGGERCPRHYSRLYDRAGLYRKRQGRGSGCGFCLARCRKAHEPDRGYQYHYA